MVKNENIICISSIDWDFIWQGHQQIMSTLAANDNRVLFIENTGARVPGVKDIQRLRNRIKNWAKGIKGIRMEGKNLFVFSPLVLPFPYFRIARLINYYIMFPLLRKWMRIMHFDEPIIWVFLPTPLSLEIINNLNAKLIIYYCIDNFRASSALARKIQKSEISLLKKADLLFVTSNALYRYCCEYNPNVHVFPFAVDFEKFEKVRSSNFIPNELKEIKKPIIGYVGGVHKWIDLPLIKEMVQRFPQYSFVFVGPIQTDISLLTGLKNVYFLGKKNHEEIPHFINNFDVCIIPYFISDYTNSVYPTKLNEYHALGKPVVSTELPEVTYFNARNDNLVFVAKTHDEFAEYIAMAVNSRDERLVNKRISSAKNNSWSTRIAQMSELIEEAIEKKKLISINWQESLLRFYRETRSKLFKISVVILSIYMVLFYTPFVWFLAKPLKISDVARHANCIVVFAGGVGESGQAGQGYEERVQHAVYLYKNGYAKYMIFSSGHTYAFKEPLIMKALAVSLGVPEDVIILEDKSSNTFQNVKFIKKILEDKNWHNILLVSSPYHMRRVSLVVKRIAQDLKITYSPNPKNRFYLHPIGEKYFIFRKQINLTQIKGLIHEYLGILYYWWKGYI